MLKKELEAIQENGTFELLESFKDQKTWKSLDEEDRGLLALLFFQYGLQLGVTSQDKKDLKKSIQLFRLAIKLRPLFLQAHFELGKTYLDLSLLTQEESFLEKAHAVFLKIEAMSPKNRSFMANFYWTWARVLFFKGRFSEELIDFHEALKYFLKAEKAVQTEALFFVDYGNVFFELDRLTKDSKLLDQAIELYKQATKKDSNCFEAWSNLACCYTEFFFNKRAPSYFHLANDCFTKLALIQKENRDFYFKWGQLLLNYAKSFHEESLLPKSIECFQLAEDSFAPKPVLYRFTAEALLLFGVFTDQLALLKLAENKIRLSLDLDPKDPNSWCLLGHLKSEFGRYFDEETYFLDAIEAFEKGLEISENHPILHFGLATACFAFGDLKNEFSFLEKAYKACTQVVATGASPPDHFWNDWGIIALKMAEFTKNTDSLKEAIRLFEKACELQKMQERHLSSDLLVNLGVAWQLLGDFEDDEKALVMSREILSEALRGDPLFVTAHHQLALTLVELGEMTSDMGSFKLAVEHFTQAIHLDSEDDHIFHDFAMGLIHQSILFHYLGEKEACSKVIREAEKLLKRAIALGNEGAFYTLACLHSLLGNLEQSLEALKKAESLEALPSEEDLLEDEWLENLRQSDLFTSFLEKR